MSTERRDLFGLLGERMAQRFAINASHAEPRMTRRQLIFLLALVFFIIPTTLNLESRVHSHHETHAAHVSRHFFKPLEVRAARYGLASAVVRCCVNLLGVPSRRVPRRVVCISPSPRPASR